MVNVTNHSTTAPNVSPSAWLITKMNPLDALAAPDTSCMDSVTKASMMKPKTNE